MLLRSVFAGFTKTHVAPCRGIAAICIHSRIAYELQLERRGVSIPEDGGTTSDPQLLMEVMEQREVIEETDDPVVLQTMLQENKLLQKATTEVRNIAAQALHRQQSSCAATSAVMWPELTCICSASMCLVSVACSCIHTRYTAL